MLTCHYTSILLLLKTHQGSEMCVRMIMWRWAALSRVRSWPLAVKGWNMRHHRPDFKARPPTGVNVQERVSGGYKSTTMNTGWGRGVNYCCKPSLAEKPERRGRKNAHTRGPQRRQKKPRVNLDFAGWRKNEMVGLIIELQRHQSLFLLESMTQK